MEWIVQNWTEEIHRVSPEPVINSGLGFMHYPPTINDQKAFQMLKDSMIERHERELKKIQDSLDKLKQLKLEGK